LAAAAKVVMRHAFRKIPSAFFPAHVACLQLKSSAAAAKRERDLTDHERNINRSSFLFLFVDAVLHACSRSLLSEAKKEGRIMRN
jgi:hypothetical protein